MILFPLYISLINQLLINAIDLKKNVGEHEYEFYKKVYKTAKGTVDIYVYFFELGFNILKNNQLLCLITPNRYLSVNYGTALREYLIDNFIFIEIGDYSTVKVFSEASTYPIVSLFKKEVVTDDYNFKSFTYTDNQNILINRLFNSSLLKSFNDNLLGFILSSKFNISKKVIDVSENLSNAGIINATSTAGEAEKFHDYISDNDNGFKLVNTGTIDRYSVTWGANQLTDKGIKYIRPYLPKSNELLGNNRFQLYSKSKIIFAKIAIRTEAFYDDIGEYASINTNCIHSFNKEFNPLYILGWMNSKLFQYVFECFFDGLKMSGGYLLYSAPNISNMYIKKAKKSEQDKIALKVAYLINLKSNNALQISDIEIVENDIDNLFYQLYELTEEEIKIVEAN